jgi:ribonuclease P protein component
MASVPAWRHVQAARFSSAAAPEAGSVSPRKYRQRGGKTKRVDRPVQAAARAEPARPGVGNASGAVIVHRRHRLSRSRDFDAVYRQGRSTSTRFLVLYWFDRDEDGSEPRLGLAVPKATGNAVARNRIKRQLRELWRDRLEAVPAGRDYVLIAKPGLPEAVEANGFDWLGARVDEVLQKAAA